MFGKYKVAHLLGITREHEKQFRYVEKELTKKGYICFAPVIYNLDEYTMVSDLVDDMCYEKLLVCDICVIVTPEHVGKSTHNRIEQAIKLNKPVYIFTDSGLELYDGQLSQNQSSINMDTTETEVIRNEHDYRYDICPNCNSELKTKKSTITRYCSKRHNAPIINCPCCNKGFVAFC